MAWIGETSGNGSNGGEESKRRKVEKLECEKRSLIPRSCSSKNTKEEGRKIEESLSSRINNSEVEESSTSEDDDDDGIERKFGPKVGDTIDNLLDMLFTDYRDFLVKFNGQKVKFDDLNGKTIVLFTLSLVGKCCHAVDNDKGEGMMDLVDSYNELRPHDGVEFVFVPRFKGQSTIGNECSLCSEEECFNNLFSKMSWPSVRFSDKQKCHRIETVLWPCFPWYSRSPYYIIFDPNGKVLLTNTYRFKPGPSIFHLYGGADLFSLADLSLQNLKEKDREEIKKLNLDQLLKSPHRDFLLARDGTKVPVSSLRDKVVGLYFCDNVPTPPPRMEALKKVYREAMDMGRDFEIVQINFHFRNDYENFPHNEEMPLQVWSEDIPWLTLPYKDMCCRRLRRLFRWHRFYWYKFKFDCHWKGDSLVIVDPRNFNVNGTRYERNAIHIVEHLGIEAYPFTRKRAVELEYAKLRQVKLHTIFPPGGPPLIRPSTSRGCDQVPRSELYGKPVLVLFSLHSRQGEFISELESKYSSQSRKFEVVYVSYDHDKSTFDEFIKEMPWLVHPYSLEVGLQWISQFALYFTWPDTLYFRADGELVMPLDSKLRYIARFYNVEDWDFTLY